MILMLCSVCAAAEQISVAVASNFTPTLRLLAEAFEAQSGHRLRISSASTGKLYAQINHGAPFDLFLAADVERPRLLEQAGKAVPGSRFTYAKGRLVLWGPSVTSTQPAEELLQALQFTHIAMANPNTAPYGAAAQRSLEKMDLWDKLQGRLVRGENIGQAYQFVASGAAQIGFVAYSQVLAGKQTPGYHWPVPDTYYPPIRQQALLLKQAEKNLSAHAFMDYLRSPEAQHLISENGYDIE
ncbi:MAG: molybdate ABC transporter substrate-binding protein [Pseudomonadota bacterium]